MKKLDPKKRKEVEIKVADKITAFVGSMWFVYLSTTQFILWLVFVERAPWQTLTLVVSLEAIYLTTFVLISQNRSDRENKRRVQEDLETDKRAADEINDMRHDLKEVIYQQELSRLDARRLLREFEDRLNKRITFANQVVRRQQGKDK